MAELATAPEARVISLSSGMYIAAYMNWDDINNERSNWGQMSLYAQSKIANILFVRELGIRLKGKIELGL